MLPPRIADLWQLNEVAQLKAELDAANMGSGYQVVISRWKQVNKVAGNKPYGATEFTKVKI